jgi:hypothetical protein
MPLPDAEPALVNLAFWARNMVAIRKAGMSWPGFSYTEPEWARLKVLAEAVEPGRFRLFTWINAAVFIAIAIVGIAGVFLPLASVLFPIPAETKPLPFLLLLATTALLIIGIGLPLSMRIAAPLAADAAMRARLSTAREDAALGAKVARQIWRMTIIMCGVLVPGALLFIAFDIEGGPIITVLKWVSIGLLVAATGLGVLLRRP